MAIATFDVLETAQISNPKEGGILVSTEFETAVVTNPEPIFTPYYDVFETALLQDYAQPSAQVVRDVLETAPLQDYVHADAHSFHDTVESAVALSTAYPTYPDVTILETAVVIDANYYDATESTLDVIEAFVASDYAHVGLVDTLYETAVVSDSTYGASVENVLETAVVTSLANFSTNETLDVLETLVVFDIDTPQLIARNTLHEIAYISSDAYPSEAAERNYIFTANTVNWAMSAYTGLTLTGMAGRYAVDANTLYARDATYANGVIDIGHVSLNSPQRKAVRSAYVYAKYDSSLSIEVTADAQGTTATYKYDSPRYSSDAARASRTSFGKGFRSTYFKLKITTRGFAVIRRVIPEITGLSRKI